MFITKSQSSNASYRMFYDRVVCSLIMSYTNLGMYSDAECLIWVKRVCENECFTVSRVCVPETLALYIFVLQGWLY